TSAGQDGAASAASIAPAVDAIALADGSAVPAAGSSAATPLRRKCANVSSGAPASASSAAWPAHSRSRGCARCSAMRTTANSAASRAPCQRKCSRVQPMLSTSNPERAWNSDIGVALQRIEQLADLPQFVRTGRLAAAQCTQHQFAGAAVEHPLDQVAEQALLGGVLADHCT